MRYLIGLPLCLMLVSGVLWFMSRGSYQVGAQGTPAAPVLDPRPADSAGSARLASSSEEPGSAAFDPVVIGACMLMPIQEQNVASQVDGVLTEVLVNLGGRVEKGQRLAQLDDQKLRLQIELLQIKAESVSAEKIAQALFEEADAKVKYAEKANAGLSSSVPELELRTYQAQRERFVHEVKKAREDREEARKELAKARVQLQMHQVSSALNGEVVKVFKKAGETVKQGETLFRVARIDRLSIEGFCKVFHASALRPGQRVLVEAEQQGPQAVTLIGHTAPVNCLAMASDGKLLASASDDGNVLLWSWPAGGRVAALHHGSPVHAVDIVRLHEGDQAKYLIVTGGEDRVVRVWTYLAGTRLDGPPLELSGHDGALRTLSFAPDGKSFVSGGDDRRLGWWKLNPDRSTTLHWVHALGAWKQAAHQGAVTSTHLSAGGTLVSTGSDNVQRVWQLAEGQCKLVKVHRGRTGDVPRLGASPEGSRLLLDHGDELRVIQRESGVVLSTLQNSRHVRFEEFACFSPSGKFILSASADGRLHLSRTPVEAIDRAGRLQKYLAAVNTAPLPDLGGFEVRQYQVPKASQARCGVFAPDESVFFTGGTDRVIRVWSIPAEPQWAPREAVLNYVGSELEPGTDLVRIQAELDNPTDASRSWRPGTSVNLKVFPTTPASLVRAP